MIKHISRAIIVILTLMYFTASIHYNKQQDSSELPWQIFFFIKEELLVMGLCWYAYTKATCSTAIFCVVSIGTYAFIQMLVYIMVALFASSTIKFTVLLSNPWVSGVSSIISGAVLVLLNWLLKSQHISNFKYIIKQISIRKR